MTGTRFGDSLRSKLIIIALVLLPMANWLYQRATHVYTDDAYIAADMIDIRSKVAGWLVELSSSSGDRLTAGQIIGQLDAREIDLQILELQAQRAAREAEHRRAEFELSMVRGQSGGNIDAARSELAAAEAALAATGSDLKFKANAWQRAEALRERKIISEQDWEQDRLAWQQADQQHQHALAAVATAAARLVEADASGGKSLILEQEIDRIGHEIETIALQVQQKQVMQLDHHVIAPTDGVVDRIFVDTGEYVTSGQRLLLLHNPQKVWVEANIKEKEVRDLRPGQIVTIHVDAYPDEEFTGTIASVGHAATSQFALLPSANPSGNFTKVNQRLPVKIAVAQRDDLLKPGMMVEVEIDTRSP